MPDPTDAATGLPSSPLFRKFPDLAGRVAWTPLARTPTPVERCPGLGDYLGRDDVFQKRDDAVSAVWGGNKVRRFEFLLADARARGATQLITVGGLASTQVVATVLFGRALGFDVTAVLFDQPVTGFARRALLASASGGGKLVRGGGYLSTAWRTWRAYRTAHRPYFIPPGASTPVANLGYVGAALELGEQVDRGECPRPDLIVLPCGSGGTVAGLAIGLAILGWPTVVVGVRITERIACNRLTIGHHIRACTGWLRRSSERYARVTWPKPRFVLHQTEIGKGYGWPTDEAVEAVPIVARMIGVPGEITYSAKGVAGLRAVCREHPDAAILYWHTLSSVPPPVGAEPAMLPAFADVFEGAVPI